VVTDGEKCLFMCSSVSTEYRRVTDGQTDKHLASALSARGETV